MVPGVAGTERTVTERRVLFPQAFPATTEMVPLEYTAGSVRLMELVPCPELITDPAGTVHV